MRKEGKGGGGPALFSQRAQVQRQGRNHSDLTDILCVCAEYLDILQSVCGWMSRGGASALKISHDCQTGAKYFSSFFRFSPKCTRVQSASVVPVKMAKLLRILHIHVPYMFYMSYFLLFFFFFYILATRAYSLCNKQLLPSTKQEPRII